MKTTVVGGAIFLLPFAAVLLVVIKAGKMAVDFATALAEKLPISKGEAVLAVYVVGTFLLVLVAFTAGLFVRSFKIEKDAASFLEDKVLNKLPPYVALRKYTDRLAGLEGKTNEDLKPVLVRMQNGWQLGFLADAFNDGQVAVFMPGAPLFGNSVEAGSLEVRKNLGYMTQAFSLYGELTVRQNLILDARLYHIPPEKAKARIEELELAAGHQRNARYGDGQQYARAFHSILFFDRGVRTIERRHRHILHIRRKARPRRYYFCAC